jgi:hypothetical protein
MILSDVQSKWASLSPVLDERRRRLWAATEARSLGHGGVVLVAEATGLSERTIRRGIEELSGSSVTFAPDRSRRSGAGRKPLVATAPDVKAALDGLVEPTARGDPMMPLRWTCKSLRNLADELHDQGYTICVEKVRDLLQDLDYSLQSNKKTKEGASHPDRDAQFRYINRCVQVFQRQDQPVISVDTKKKELVGDFKNAGEEWRPQGQPEQVRVHDFMDPTLGKAIPYGVYDLTRNEGWVSVGIDHDTADFAVTSICTWWRQMGSIAYPDAKRLLITSDGGGSNSSRSRLWKVALQRLADDIHIPITVCHFPPGTSKWNKIEHRMFSFVTKNWRGRPLISHEVIVNLISNTTTDRGLKIQAQLDTNQYPTGTHVSDQQLSAVRVNRHKFHGDWNYTISTSSLQNKTDSYL